LIKFGNKINAFREFLRFNYLVFLNYFILWKGVRIVHLPTGIEVYCVEERRQMENRARALASLEQKLYNIAYEEQLNKRQQNRKMQVGSSGRSERIRTYNFLQDRITDHRLDENFVGVNKFLTGETLEILLESLKTEHKIEILYEILNKK